jgi:hypothetical protein
MASTTPARCAQEARVRTRANRIMAPAILVVMFAVVGCGQTASSTDSAARADGAGTATPIATTDSVAAARAHGRRLARQGKYAAAIASYEAVDLDAEANRVRRRGSAALTRSARRALKAGHYGNARRLALQSRRLRKTAVARTVLESADTKIAAATAAARERGRLAAIARDARTCSSTEKATVRNSAGTPAGCATYAADLAARRAARKAEDASGTSGDCDSNYTGGCLKPDSPDYDCAGGSGDGPDYTGPVQSVGSDPYDLDRDGDGVACETS